MADATVGRADLITNSASPNTNVIAKAVQGTGMAFTSTGNDAGTGDVTINIAVPVAVTNGGTGLTSCAQGDLFYGAGVNSIGALAKNATNSRYLANQGLGNNPSWSPINLANGVTGLLPVGNLDVSSDFNWSTAQTITLTNANTNTSDTVLRLIHNCSPGTVAANFGTTLWSQLENAGGATVDAGQFQNNWSNPAAGAETSYYDFLLRSAGTGLASKMRLFGSGALSVGSTTDPNANGIINANTGFRIGNAAASGNSIRGNGTNFVAVPSPASAQVTSPSNPTAVTSATGLHLGFGTATFGPFGFTPTVSGKVLFIITCGILAGTATVSLSAAIRYGTGTAPTNGAAPTGTAGSTFVRSTVAWAASQVTPMTLAWVATGLTLNTAYWVDLIMSASAGTAQATGGYFSAVELL
jgi:hypothetical protein